MNALKQPWVWSALVVWGVVGSALAQSQLLINEVLLNLPGTDTPHEYIELRGLPSYVIPQGTYFVGVEGDTNGNPGSLQNIFDLSGQRVGPNGFLVLLQKAHAYTPNSGATVLVNSGSGPGWGSGTTSSIGHRGDNGQTELENASATFFLIRTAVTPAFSQDIDADNNGVPDGAWTNWVVLDSVGLLDADGSGDIAYGAINFRRNSPPGSGARASGIIVPVEFTPSYVGRTTNSTGPFDWAAADIEGSAPNWLLDNTDTYPTNYGSRQLSHIGAPNFGAGTVKGLVLTESSGRTELVEGSLATDSYTIGLNVAPAGPIVIRVTAPPPLRISTDNGATFGITRSLTFSSLAAQTVLVRANEDNVVDTSPYLRPMTHAITSSADPVRYPTDLVLAPVVASVIDNDVVLLSELKVNPPGVSDGPFEFVELRGASDALLTNVYFVAVEGNNGGNPGTASLVVDLSSHRLGENGLLVLAAPGHPYTFAGETASLLDPAFSQAGGALGNGSVSFLLVASPEPIRPGIDLDSGDNGIMEGLPATARILDAVAWRDGNTSDVVYGGVVLSDDTQTPDAAARFRNNSTPLTAAAWFYGDLDTAGGGATLEFDENDVSANFPGGTPLTPGVENLNVPQVTPRLEALAHAIGDPTNPQVFFVVSDDEVSPALLSVTVASTNAAVVPDANLILTVGPAGERTLTLHPVGVGYSEILVSVSNGLRTNRSRFLYAVSAQASPSTRHHVHASDASAAIAINSDLMFIGDDENQLLRIYRRNESGEPLVWFDMTPMLGLTDIENGRPREVDIEAATLVNRRIFWMGAHSHANIAESRTNRSRVFATDWVGNGLTSTLNYVGRYDYLKLDLVNWDANNQHGKGAHYFGLEASTAEGVDPKEPKGAGFNIEGLTMAPFNDEVGYVGFRAPIVPATNRTHALIVPVLNFAWLASSDAPAGSAVFGAPIELDLYGRGIRSIERIGANYLIVAGVPGDFPGAYPHDFRLYTWTGNPADRPQERTANLTDLNPEAIVELPPLPWTPQSLIQLVSDSGRRDWYNDGTQAKFLPEINIKKFRTDWVALGGINKPTPVMTSAEVGQNGVTVWWRALAGERYRLQYKSSLASAQWTDVPGDVLAAGPFASKLDSSAAGVQRFYHVMLLP